MPLDKRSRYRRTSLTWPAAITTVPGSQTSASALISLIGSPDSDMSTNRIFGLADTDSDCTALRRPPLLHFSVGQPMSPAAARINSSVSSSQTKALKGSRSPADLKGAFTGHLRLLPCSVRSEEHTSELQSLMRISYAVFCLKKKKK